MTRYPCPYLKGEVELTDERKRHIAERHPDLLPEHRHRIAETLAEPDQSAAVVGSEAPSCSLGGTLMFGQASTWSSSWSASWTQVNVTGSSRRTSPEGW